MDSCIWFVLLFQLIIVSEQRCSTEVCLTWKVTHDELILICRVNQLLHWVKIEDPFHNIQADCVPPYPEEKCEPHYKNGTIKQEKKTNITTFEVHGKIDKRINGNWTCHHGTGRGTAVVEVTVLTIYEEKYIKGNKTTNIADSNCLNEVLQTGMLSFIFPVVCAYTHDLFIKANIRKLHGIKKKELVPALVLGLASLAIVIILLHTNVSSNCNGINWGVGFGFFLLGTILTVVLLKCKCKTENNTTQELQNPDPAPLNDIELDPLRDGNDMLQNTS